MIIRPETFNRHLPANYDGVFDWDFLAPAWAGTNVTPMDLDALVERQGLFLTFETKNPGVPIPRGQRLALERLICRGRGAITTIALNAKCSDDIDGWQVWRYNETTNEIVARDVRGDAAALTSFCRRWFEYATHAPPPLWRPALKRPDLFADLVACPVEAATIHLEALTSQQRAEVLARFATQ